ncbi:MAG: nitronate monooxygenase [Acidobacteriota bacterium]|nr:nitronate monooxygenase [Acidobacteriota bacterium]
MGGGATTIELVTAVCEAGALGFIAAAYLTGAQITEFSHTLRARTSRPFGINLFAPVPVPDGTLALGTALRLLAPFHASLGLPPPALPPPEGTSFGERLAASLDSGALAFSFTFGVLPEDAVQAIKNRGMFLIGTATTVQEAAVLERSGVDAVVAQGSEAGAHRGTFATGFEDAMIGGMALVPQMVDAVKIPVLASGGIMDGRGIVAALALGASGVQMGTAFLTCDEAGIPEVYKQAILQAREDQTRVTRAFSGRPARGIANRFMTEFDAAEDSGAILLYPIQNALTRPLRNAAAREGDAECLSLWAGQGLRMARRQSAAKLIERLGEETVEALRGLPGFRET